jgi:hypothetical protein
VNGKTVKVLPSNIDELITDIALAHWISGDGHYERVTGGVRLATHSFTLKEVLKLRSILLDKFQLDSTHYEHGKGKGQYFIRFPKQQLPKLQSLVNPFIPPTMAYRVGLSSSSSS